MGCCKEDGDPWGKPEKTAVLQKQTTLVSQHTVATSDLFWLDDHYYQVQQSPQSMAKNRGKMVGHVPKLRPSWPENVYETNGQGLCNIQPCGSASVCGGKYEQ
jgi:hypothetical protein